jgi:acetyl esterase/lipase
MSVTPAPTTEWTGPTRFLAPPEPRVLADGSKRYEGITYAVAPGYRPLQLDVWVPATPAPPPLVVWIHGGGWMFGDRRYLPETLRPNQLFEESVAAGPRHCHDRLSPCVGGAFSGSAA